MQDYFLHETSVVDEGTEIGAGTQIWHFCHISKNSRLGANCRLGQNVYVDANVTIGAGCKLQNNVSIYNGVTLEDEVFCGPSCVFTNVTTPRAFVDRRSEFAQTLVQRGATIGANATIVCGHTIGRYALIGAGAVVAKDVSPHALIVGVPGRHIAWVCKCGEILGKIGELGQKTCARCNSTYRINEGSCDAVNNI